MGIINSNASRHQTGNINKSGKWVETGGREEAHSCERGQLLFSSSWLSPRRNVCAVVPEESEIYIINEIINEL